VTAAPTAAAHAEVAFQTGKKWIELLPRIKLMPPTSHPAKKKGNRRIQQGMAEVAWTLELDEELRAAVSERHSCSLGVRPGLH
jgi:hypothetical protein